MFLSDWIPHNAPADGSPPNKLFKFILWAVKGAWPALWAAGILSVVAGVAEVFAAILLGMVIDKALALEPRQIF